MTPLQRSALLDDGRLSSVTLARFALGLLGGVMLPAMLAGQTLQQLSDGAGLVQFVVDDRAVVRRPAWPASCSSGTCSSRPVPPRRCREGFADEHRRDSRRQPE